MVEKRDERKADRRRGTKYEMNSWNDGEERARERARRKQPGPRCLYRGAETDATPRRIKREKERETDGDRGRWADRSERETAGRMKARERSAGVVRGRRREKAAVVLLGWLGEIRMRRTNGLTKVPKVGDTQSRGHVLHERTPRAGRRSSQPATTLFPLL